MMKEEFHKNYFEDESKTGQDLVKKLVEMFVTCSKNEFLVNIKKFEKLRSILDKELKENNVKIENINENDWLKLFPILVKKITQNYLRADFSHTARASIPDWFKPFEKTSSLLNGVRWTPKLNVLTKETSKKFLLPETVIGFKEEDGKRIIAIKGVVIFVSQMNEEMKRLKKEHPEVEEIKIVGFKSVHIDCDLDNDNWHGTNIGIVTDKLFVDDVINHLRSSFN